MEAVLARARWSRVGCRLRGDARGLVQEATLARGLLIGVVGGYSRSQVMVVGRSPVLTKNSSAARTVW